MKNKLLAHSRRFYKQLAEYYCSIKVINDWIGTQVGTVVS